MRDKERLAEYLAALLRVLGDWERLKKETGLDRLKQDRLHCHLICHVVLLAVQTAIDTANHLVAERKLPRPSRTYREAFEILGREKVIPQEAAGRLAELADFRNELIHEYVALDLDKVWNLFQTEDAALRDFLKAASDELSRG